MALDSVASASECPLLGSDTKADEVRRFSRSIGDDVIDTRVTALRARRGRYITLEKEESVILPNFP